MSQSAFIGISSQPTYASSKSAHEMSRRKKAKTIDCGLTKFVYEDGSAPASSATKKVETPGYICPLYNDNEFLYGDKCDVFSFGVVLIS